MSKTVLIIVCLFALTTAACVRSQPPATFDEYEKHLDEGKNFMLSGQFEKARKSYEKAVEIAVKSGRGNEIASANADLAQAYCSDKRFDECEEKLDAARNDCQKDSGCEPRSLEMLISQTFFLYVFYLKDAQKIESMSNLLEESREKLGDEGYGRLLCLWVSRLNEAGFPEESKTMAMGHHCRES